MSNWRYNNINDIWMNLDFFSTIEIIKLGNSYQTIARYHKGESVILYSNVSKEKSERWLISFISGMKEDLIPLSNQTQA